MSSNNGAPKIYKLILDDPEPPERESSSKKTKKSKKSRNLRKRNNTSNAWESDEDSGTKRKKKREEPRKVEESEDEYEKAIKEDEQDEREREEFARRLRERDDAKTRKIAEDRSAKPDSETARRRNLADDPDARKQVLPSIRERSRQEYLKMRVEQQMMLTKQDVLDEELLFKNQKLSKKERKELELKRETLNLAEERLKLSKKTDEYIMPEDYITEKGKIDKRKKEQALYQRYEEKRDNQFFSTEQEQWESNQIAKSSLNVGAQDRQKGDNYEYVFDEKEFNWDDWEPETRDDEAAFRKRVEEEEKRVQTIQEVRQTLPIYSFREELLQAIQDHRVLIIVGETGSGKTTQLPQYLVEAGYTKGGRKVGCTQPRRVAAMSVAARVADEMGVRLGHEVGYSIRFEDCSSEKTVLKYMTDGMLLREFMTDPLLSTYSCMIIDEAHERTLHTDVLLGLVKRIMHAETDLRLIISSATLDAQKFAKYFRVGDEEPPIFHIPGRMFEVKKYYTKNPEANYIHAAIGKVMELHINPLVRGDILVFLTGQDEIEYVQQNLEHARSILGSKISALDICPIYANLPPDLQAKIFEPTPPNARKVVLATNIAETSVTIDGIAYVIDSGYVKQNFYSPKSRMQSLEVVPCSKASAEQRAGRAGRIGPGWCFRLYTKYIFEKEMPFDAMPEIQRTNLANVILLLQTIGVRDIMQFEFMDPPHTDCIVQAMNELLELEALRQGADGKPRLTKLGQRMAEFPLDPMLSKVILESEKYHCSEEIISIISMLTVQGSIFYMPKEKKVAADMAKQNFYRPGGDHFTLLNVWNQ
ncbi:952_t:CDS:10, partial [Paraglomus occultum]